MTTSRALAMAHSGVERAAIILLCSAGAVARIRLAPSGGRALGNGSRLERAQLPPEIGGDRAHARFSCLALGVGVVVGVRVDVVGMELPAAVGDEFDARDADAVVREEAPISIDDRVREAVDDAKPRRARRRAFSDRAEGVADLA